jgi:hypothetical protein
VILSNGSRGYTIGLEYGTHFGAVTDDTYDVFDLATKIAIIHFIEDPFYYYRLEMMERHSNAF